LTSLDHDPHCRRRARGRGGDLDDRLADPARVARWPSIRRIGSSRSASRRRSLVQRFQGHDPHAVTGDPRFRDVVLLAGGRNKGLDLASIATEHERVKSVVALGELRRSSVRRRAWCPVVDGDAGRFDSAGRGVATRPAVAGLRQLRLVPRWRVSPRRRLQQLVPTTSRRMHHGSTTTVIGDRRRQALERAATCDASDRDAWHRSRNPAVVAFYAIAVVVAVFVMLGLVMVLSHRPSTSSTRPIPVASSTSR
jgi:hypothetical protein